jgi:bacteriorhodopsin
MADIDVVKKSSTAWVWILAAILVIAFIIWFAMGRSTAPQAGFLLHPAAPLVEVPALASV